MQIPAEIFFCIPPGTPGFYYSQSKSCGMSFLTHGCTSCLFMLHQE
jgi:hypothetical protein